MSSLRHRNTGRDPDNEETEPQRRPDQSPRSVVEINRELYGDPNTQQNTQRLNTVRRNVYNPQQQQTRQLQELLGRPPEQEQQPLVREDSMMNERLGGVEAELGDMQEKLDTLIHQGDAIIDTTSDTNAVVQQIQRVSNDIQDGVANVSRQVRRGFSDLSDKLKTCMNPRHFYNNMLWCLSYLIQWFVMLVVWLHELYIRTFVVGTGAASNLAGGIPYIGAPMAYMVKVLSFCLFVFGGCLIYGYILATAMGPEWGFEFLVGLFQKIFSATIIFLFESIASLFKYVAEVDYLGGLRDIFSTISGVTIGLPLRIIGCIFKFIYCYMMCTPGGSYVRADCATCGPELNNCIQNAAEAAVSQQQPAPPDAEQTGGGEDSDDKKYIAEINNLIKKIRTKLKKEHGKIYDDIQQEARSAIKELFKPLKKGETHFDQVINVGSTVVGNIFTTILKQPINKTTKNKTKSFEKASELFTGIENTITTIGKKQEKNIDMENYDAKKIQEIIELSKKEKDLKNRAPIIKQLITTITKFAFVPNGVTKVVAVLTMNTNNKSITKKSISRSIRRKTPSRLSRNIRSIVARKSKKKRKHKKTKKGKKGKRGKNKSKKSRNKRKKRKKTTKLK